MRSAEAAKRAFDILAVEKSSKSSTEIQDKAPVIIATVKGDVHDIGKNIVKVVLESYGYPVKDLGKNVSKEEIYNTYLEAGALAIGLSALMTTTVDSMRETIEYLHQNDVKCPIIVGGAVLTQDIATDIKADYYAKDALTAANILNTLV
jgi:5-methyltetrahydrofolate--homocysteine methyltransferase